MSFNLEKSKKEFDDLYEEIFEKTIDVYDIVSLKKKEPFQEIVSKIKLILKMIKKSEKLHALFIKNKIHDDDIAEKVLQIAGISKTHNEILKGLKKTNPVAPVSQEKNNIN